MGQKTHLILNSSELGAGTRGASLGPVAIQVAAENWVLIFLVTNK